MRENFFRCLITENGRDRNWLGFFFNFSKKFEWFSSFINFNFRGKASLIDLKRQIHFQTISSPEIFYFNKEAKIVWKYFQLKYIEL